MTAIHLVSPEVVETGNTEVQYMTVRQLETWADLGIADVGCMVFVEGSVLPGPDLVGEELEEKTSGAVVHYEVVELADGGTGEVEESVLTDISVGTEISFCRRVALTSVAIGGGPEKGRAGGGGGWSWLSVVTL